MTIIRCAVVSLAILTTLGACADGEKDACARLDECDCYEAAPECRMETEGCWCPTQCGVEVECFCSGGDFLSCETAE